MNHLLTALDLEYCSKDLYTNLRTQADEIRRMLNGYIDWLKEKKVGEKEPGVNLHIREAQAEYDVNPEENNP